MRDGWKQATIGQIATIVHGGTPKTSDQSYWNGGIPWVRPVDMTAALNKRIHDTPKHISLEGLTHSSASLLPPGSVIVSTRGTIGLIAINTHPMATNQSCEALIVDRAALGDYVAFWLEAHRSELLSRASGTTITGLAPSSLKEVPILVPPLDEQRRIVDLIGAVDEAIQAAEQARGRAGSARANLIRDWFASADALPKSLGEVTSVLQGSPLVKTLQGQQSGPVPWYKIADMTRPGNEFGYTRAETMVASEVIARNNGKILPRGTIVFPRVGAAVLTEKKRILDTAGACDENHLAIAPSDSLVPGYTLAFFENFPLASLVQSGAVPSLNQGLVRQIPIPIPPVPEQVELAEVTMAMRESERELTCCKLALETLRSALLSELLSGDHEIPASYDAVMG